MPTLTIAFSATATQGGESLGPDIVTALTVGNTVHDKMVNVPGATSATYQTIYDSSVDSATFNFASLLVDPDGLQATEKFINVRTTNNGVTAIEKVSSFTKVKTWSGSAQTTGAISKIEVANLASTTATTDDLIVRLTAWKV